MSNPFTHCPSCESNMVRLESGPSEVRACLSCNSRWTIGGSAGMPFTVNMLAPSDPMPTPMPTKPVLTPLAQSVVTQLEKALREKCGGFLVTNNASKIVPLLAPGSVPAPPPPGPLPPAPSTAPTPKTVRA